MGTKGNKLTQDSVMMAELLKEKLNVMGDITFKKMFGGHGIFHKGKMFGIVDSKGQGYFKANDRNRAVFERNDSHQHGRMPYFSIPDHILNDSEKLLEWAHNALPEQK